MPPSAEEPARLAEPTLAQVPATLFPTRDVQHHLVKRDAGAAGQVGGFVHGPARAIQIPWRSPPSGVSVPTSLFG